MMMILSMVPANARTVEATEPVPVRMSPGTTSVRPDREGMLTTMLSSGAVVPPNSSVN